MSLGNRAIETTLSSGPGPYTLEGPVDGYQSLKAAVIEITGDAVGPWEVDYVVSDDIDAEIATGTLTDGGLGKDTLARDLIESSTNGDAAVDWGTNVKTVRLSPSARWLATLPAADAERRLVISGGIVTPRFAQAAIDTEAEAASDDLTNIATTFIRDGRWLLLRTANGARTVVVRNAATGAGQIHLADAADFTLDSTDKWLLLARRGADWFEVVRSFGADAAAARAFYGVDIDTSNFAQKDQNLADLTDPAVARNNLGGNASGARTVSTSGPSGGADGDIWYQY